MDWLLTVPLLLMELVFVMGFKETSQTVKYSTILGSLAALMIILGYPGEIADSLVVRWVFWALAMLPFIAIVIVLFFMLNKCQWTNLWTVKVSLIWIWNGDMKLLNLKNDCSCGYWIRMKWTLKIKNRKGLYMECDGSITLTIILLIKLINRTEPFYICLL